MLERQNTISLIPMYLFVIHHMGQKESESMKKLTSLVRSSWKVMEVSAIPAAVRRAQAPLNKPHHGDQHHQPGQQGSWPHLSGHHQSWCRSGGR